MRALVLSGGGAKGAFTVGAIRRLSRDPRNVGFDLISGTSIGAIIAPFVTSMEFDLMEQLFTTLEEREVIRRARRILRGFVYNSNELKKRLEESITVARADEIISHQTTTTMFGTVCLQTGKITYFHTGARVLTRPTGSRYDVIRVDDRKDLIKAILASANQPLLMGPIVRFKDPKYPASPKDHQYVDGGVRAYAPFDIVIDEGATDVWAIITSPGPGKRDMGDAEYKSLTGGLMRTIGLLTTDVGDNDLDHALLRMDTAGITHHVLRPTSDLKKLYGVDALDFVPEKMKEVVGYGSRQAAAAGW
jgi:predicted acylesterase/phospholipase RssA